MDHEAAINRLQDLQGRFLSDPERGDLRSYDVAEILDIVRRESRLERIVEMPKSDGAAVRFRKRGNQFYLERDFDQALVFYNQSISHAEVGSEQLGIGYGNRSAVLFEQRDYELALYSIDLAKKHNYPERLMPKLLAREVNCKQRIAEGYSKGTVPKQRMGINVDTNPRIPFLAKGIGMSYDAKFGRGLVAEKDFNPGDVICDEPIELCALEPNLLLSSCNQCSAELVEMLIPCLTCPMVMFCSEKCRELNWKLYHRFECAVASKHFISSFFTVATHPRLFFYGLSQFGDDLQAMMDYCEVEVSSKLNPLEIDFVNLNRLEVFKAYHSFKPASTPEMSNEQKFVASVHYLTYLQHPLVRSIISTEDQRRFFLRSIQDYINVSTSAAKSVNDLKGHNTTLITPIVSLCNHSCDPNATAIVHRGRTKLVLLRPVRQGEQIFSSCAPPWWDSDQKEDQLILNFKCQCVVCDRESDAGRQWQSMLKRPFPKHAIKNMDTLMAVENHVDTHVAARLNAFQQFFKRFAVLHPHAALGPCLERYCLLLNNCSYTEDEALLRARLQAEFC
uniref:SET and MYND domain-containing protein 4 n=1 Tax=Culex pipiens TaxID=7175 RepID=A0A8D8CEQ7_CULPI